MRCFKRFQFTENAENLVLGNSIVKKLLDNSLPGDISVHAYSRSPSRDKIGIAHLKLGTKMHRNVENGTKLFLENTSKPVPELLWDYNNPSVNSKL